jgi:hypothetical protein
VPVDLGSTPVMGIAASVYARLRRVLGFPPALVKEPYQVLDEVEF